MVWGSSVVDTINTSIMGSKNGSFVEPSGDAPRCPPLLACGFCQHMWSINASAISLTGFGVGPYITTLIASTSLYPFPFKAPAQVAPRGPWKMAQRRAASSATRFKRARPWTQLMEVLPLPCRHPPPTIPLANTLSTTQITVGTQGSWYHSQNGHRRRRACVVDP